MTPATILAFDGTEQPITEWALDYGILPAVIIARLERGLSVEQAITTPMAAAPGQRLPIFSDKQKPPRAKPIVRGHYHTIDGVSKTLAEWAEGIGISGQTLRGRMRYRSLAEALAMPKGRHAKPGVSSNLEAFEGTGAGRSAQEIPEISFSEKAETE